MTTVEVSRVAMETLIEEIEAAVENSDRELTETAAGYRLGQAIDEANEALKPEVSH